MERKEHWEDVYRSKQPTEVSWFQEHPEKSLDIINESGISMDQPVIDVGGGASRLVDQLIGSGYSEVSVLDIAGSALAHAKTRLGADADKVRWIESDVTDFDPPEQFALWHDRAVFHFLTDETDRKRYLAVLERALLPGAHVIIATFALDGPEKCSGLTVERYDADKLQSVLGNDFLLIDTESEEHLTPASKIQRFIYFHLQRRGKIVT